MFKLNKRETVNIETGDSIITALEFYINYEKIFDVDFWYNDENEKECVYIYINSEHIRNYVKELMVTIKHMDKLFNTFIGRVYQCYDCIYDEDMSLIDNVIVNMFNPNASDYNTYLYGKEKSGNVFSVNVSYVA